MLELQISILERIASDLTVGFILGVTWVFIYFAFQKKGLKGTAKKENYYG